MARARAEMQGQMQVKMQTGAGGVLVALSNSGKFCPLFFFFFFFFFAWQASKRVRWGFVIC